ncbi:MAG: hypothetical protein WAV93_10350 [Bacteroidales bacterium]
MEMQEHDSSSRRKFIRRFGLGLGSVAVVGTAAAAGGSTDTGSGETVRLLSPDGTLVEVDRSAIKKAKTETRKLIRKSYKGIPDRKFVMVIDLAKCKNARKFVDACQ